MSHGRRAALMFLGGFGVFGIAAAIAFGPGMPRWGWLIVNMTGTMFFVFGGRALRQRANRL